MNNIKYFEKEKTELERLKKQIESLTLKYIYTHKMFVRRVQFMTSKIEESKSKLFIAIKESGLYESFDQPLNDVIFRIDYIKETLNGFCKSEKEKELLKLINDPQITHEILKLMRGLDDGQ